MLIYVDRYMCDGDGEAIEGRLLGRDLRSWGEWEWQQYFS